MFSGLRHRTVRGGDHQNRAVHLRRARDHIFHVIGVSRAINVRVVAIRGFIFDVRGRNRDAARFLFRRVVNRIKSANDDLRIMFSQYFGDRRRQRRLAVIDVSDRADIDVRFTSIKFLFRHYYLSS